MEMIFFSPLRKYCECGFFSFPFLKIKCLLCAGTVLGMEVCEQKKQILHFMEDSLVGVARE